MNFRIKIFQIYVPTFVKKKMLRELFSLTARAFRSKVPRMKGFSYGQSLKEYALFTTREAEKAIHQGQDLKVIKNRLYQDAYQLGQKLRRNFHVRSSEEVMTMSGILYKLLNIEFQGNLRRDIIISRCFFSNFYSSQVCQIISSLDEGMAAGLSAGGKLHFYQTITEGKDCCRGHFVLGED